VLILKSWTIWFLLLSAEIIITVGFSTQAILLSGVIHIQMLKENMQFFCCCSFEVFCGGVVLGSFVCMFCVPSECRLWSSPILFIEPNTM
jgi:hypothetical protein